MIDLDLDSVLHPYLPFSADSAKLEESRPRESARGRVDVLNRRTFHGTQD